MLPHSYQRLFLLSGWLRSVYKYGFIVVDPPRIISAQRNLTLNETQDLRLKCNASGNPKPDIIWTKIPYPSPLHSVEGVVIVKNTNKTESGVYQCRASNGIGEDAIATASVVINCKFKTKKHITKAQYR